MGQICTETRGDLEESDYALSSWFHRYPAIRGGRSYASSCDRATVDYMVLRENQGNTGFLRPRISLDKSVLWNRSGSVPTRQSARRSPTVTTSARRARSRIGITRSQFFALNWGLAVVLVGMILP